MEKGITPEFLAKFGRWAPWRVLDEVLVEGSSDYRRSRYLGDESEVKAFAHLLAGHALSAIGHRKNAAQLVSRIHPTVAQWVKSLGPCGAGQQYEGCPRRQTEGFWTDDSVAVSSLCDDFDLAYHGARSLEASVLVGSGRASALEALLGNEATTDQLRGKAVDNWLKIAKKLSSMSPMAYAYLLTRLTDDTIATELAETALLSAIHTDEAEATAYWNLARIQASQERYEIACELVTAGSQRVESITELRRMLKKAETWKRQANRQ